MKKQDKENFVKAIKNLPTESAIKVLEQFADLIQAEEGAAHGDPDSQYRLGLALYDGTTCMEQDRPRGAQLLQEAAYHDHEEATLKAFAGSMAAAEILEKRRWGHAG